MFKAPFSFDGRIRRIEYFLSGLISSVVGGIVWTIAFAGIMAGAMSGSTAGAVGGSIFGTIIGFAVYVGLLWFGLAQGVKRLHDLNKSGWMILIMLIPIANFIFALYMLFADGTVGPNEYGNDPKNRAPYQAAPSPVNVTVNINREEVKVEKPAEAPKAETPKTEAPIEEISEVEVVEEKKAE